MAVEREDADKSIASLQKRLAARKQEVKELKGEIDFLRSGSSADVTRSESGVDVSPATTSAGDTPGGPVADPSIPGKDQSVVTLPKKDLERLRRQAKTSTELATQVRELSRARSVLESRVAELEGHLDKIQRSKPARPSREELMRVANLATETLFRELQIGGQTSVPVAPGLVH
jgi:cell division protein FtsB